MEFRDRSGLTRREQLKQDLERLRNRGLIVTADKLGRHSRQDVIDRIVAGEIPRGRYIIGGMQTRQIQ
jgi:hypothetical protein